ncbi:hypothetical protein DUT90_04080 [Polaribacter sp. WD7]|nr:hypothetical protein DUT90_04080 [Polaribacter sp. WD7]
MICFKILIYKNTSKSAKQMIRFFLKSFIEVLIIIRLYFSKTLNFFHAFLKCIANTAINSRVI